MILLPSILKLPIVDQMNGDRVAAVRLAGALERPDDVLRREGRAVMPGDAFAHVHPHLGLVVVPAPVGEQARLEVEVGLLADVLVEDRAVDRLDRRVDGGRPDGRIEGRQVDVVGDGHRVALGAPANAAACKHAGPSEGRRAEPRPGGVKRRSC